MVWVAEPYRPPGVAFVYPIPFLWRVDPYRVVGSGFSRWDLAAAALAAAGASVVASVLWCEPSSKALTPWEAAVALYREPSGG
jgi:hypothetical protein